MTNHHWFRWAIVLVASAALMALNPHAARASSNYDIYYDSLASGTGDRDIWVMNANGSDPQEFIADGMQPSWSTTATTPVMVFQNSIDTQSAHCEANSATGGPLDVVGLDAANPTTVATNGLGVCGDVRISPDGTQIVYANSTGVSVQSIANPSANATLVPVPNQQSCYKATDTSEACSFALDPSWINESTVAYDNGAGPGMFSISTSGTSNLPTAITNPGTFPDGTAWEYPAEGDAVNPAGNEIAIATWAPTGSGDNLGNEGIYVVALGGSIGTEVAAAPSGHTYDWPQWSPDGSTIVFEDDTAGQPVSTIDSVPAGGGAVTVLTPGDTTAQNPSFGPVPPAVCSTTTANDLLAAPLRGGPLAQAATEQHCVDVTVKCGNTDFPVPSACFVVAKDVSADPVAPTGTAELDILAPNYRGRVNQSATYQCQLTPAAGANPVSSYCVVNLLVNPGQTMVTPVYDGDSLHKREEGTHIDFVTSPPASRSLSAALKDYLVTGGATLEHIAGLEMAAGGVIFVATSGVGTPLAGALAGEGAVIYAVGDAATLLGGVLGDPPDPDYATVVAPHVARAPDVPSGNSPLARTTRQYDADALQFRAISAVLPTTLNRAVSAGKAGDAAARTAQIEAAIRYLDQLAALTDSEIVLQRKLAGLLRSAHEGTITLSASSRRAAEHELGRQLPKAVMTILRAFGLSAAQIDQVKRSLSATRLPASVNVAGELTNARLIASETKLAAGLQALAQDPAPAAFPTLPAEFPTP
jgi:hypothetical protein